MGQSASTASVSDDTSSTPAPSSSPTPTPSSHPPPSKSTPRPPPPRPTPRRTPPTQPIPPPQSTFPLPHNPALSPLLPLPTLPTHIPLPKIRSLARSFRRSALLLSHPPSSNDYSTSSSESTTETTDETTDLNDFLQLLTNPSTTLPNKKTLLSFGFDRASFNRYLLPPHGLPPGGVLDCLFHALSSTHPKNPPLVHLPDIMMFVAIFSTPDCFEAKKRLTFRIYDSYQKRGVITKDTLKRFIAAVYGTECLERSSTKTLLEDFFASEKTELKYEDYALKISEDSLLLTWLESLADVLLCNHDLLLKEYKLYKPTIGGGGIKMIRNLRKRYHLTRVGLFECRRKFHGLADGKSQDSHPVFITKEKFMRVVREESEEMGHGGFFPRGVALKVYEWGGEWDLKRVLEFGCGVVRGDGRKFVWEVLGGWKGCVEGMIEHVVWRRGEEVGKAVEMRDLMELGIVEEGVEEMVLTLDEIMGLVLKEVGVPEEEFDYPHFIIWAEKDPKRRIGPLLMEFKLIASVIFGMKPATPMQEFKIIQEIIHRHKERYPTSSTARRGPAETVWYILSTVWWKKWVVYANTGDDDETTTSLDQTMQFKPTGTSGKHVPQSPNEIDNNSLLKDGSLALKPHLKFHQDFELIPPLAWAALQAWHDGGPPIHRTVIPRPIPTPTSEIELYPLFLTISLIDSTTGQPRPFQQWVPVSRIQPLNQIVESLKQSLKTDSQTRLWKMGRENDEGEKQDDRILDLTLSLGEQASETQDGDVLMLELQVDGEWIRGKAPKEESVPSSEEESTGDGVVGLYNMGNTCYLNSSIQCLSHTPLLREYFTTKAYLRDINTTNPLGHQGRLAQSSAVLINQLWKPHDGNYSVQSNPGERKQNSPVPLAVPSLTPKSFKDAIGKFNDHFAGNEQHDAQELLAYLLSGLSEDLNRIESKPYIEQPDSDGRPDKELADIWWRNHLRREMSIIVALFTGQYKSLLTCKVCKYESARFEPFAFLQLPLPEDDLITLSVILYPVNDDKEVLKYSVRVNQDGTVMDALVSLAKVLFEDEGVVIENGDEEEEKEKEDENRNKEKEDGNEEKEKKEEEEDEDEDEDEDEEDEEDDEKKKESETIFVLRAQNMAVVDVRDCRILSITPPGRSLSQIQLRDTGDIPLLYVYELDPLPNNEDTEEDPTAPQSPTSVKTQSTSSATSTTEKQSEDEMDAITDENEVMEDAEKNETDAENDDIQPPDSSQNNPSTPQQTESPDTSTSSSSPPKEQPPATQILPQSRPSYIAIAQRKLEPVPRPYLFPFTLRTFGTPLLLRIVDLEGYTGSDLYDLVAKRIARFLPSPLPHTTPHNPPSEQPPKKSDSPTTTPRLKRREHRIQTHLSSPNVCGSTLPRYGFRLRLASRDGKRCSLCSWFECCIGCFVPDDDYPTIVQDGDTIALDWHLSVKVVEEPEDKMESLTKHKSCKENNYGYGGSITLEECLDAFAKEEKIPEAFCSKCKDFRVQTKRMSLWRLPPVMIIHLKRFQFTQHMRRKLRNLVVFPTEGLDLSRIVASDNADVQQILFNENGNGESSSENAKRNSDGRSTPLYDLYGVIHHQGALSGGHYVASLKSEMDQKWRLFNDAQVYEISQRDIVDATAYILFYIRRDVKEAKLEEVWDTSERDGEGVTEEQIDRLVKSRERCVVS